MVFFFFKEMGLLIFDLSAQKEKTLSNASENSLDVLFWYTLKKGLRFYSNKKHLGDIYQLSVCPSVCIFFILWTSSLNQFQPNLAKNIIVWWRFKFVKWGNSPPLQKDIVCSWKKWKQDHMKKNRKRYKIFLFNTIGLRLRLISFPYR